MEAKCIKCGIEIKHFFTNLIYYRYVSGRQRRFAKGCGKVLCDQTSPEPQTGNTNLRVSLEIEELLSKRDFLDLLINSTGLCCKKLEFICRQEVLYDSCGRVVFA